MFKCSNESGQTLIETIVAVYIVVLGVVGILAMGLALLALGGQTGERILATNLAREGLGVVQTIRNSNRLDPGQSWPYGLELAAGTYNHKRVDYDSTEFTAATGCSDSDTPGQCIVNCTNCDLCLYSGPTYDYYKFCGSGGDYKRLITIEAGDATYERKITSTLWWQDRTGPHIIDLEIRLTNWR